MTTILIALLASLLYGASDFLGALSARRLSVVKASVVIFLAATVAAALALALAPWAYSDQALWSGVFAGLFAVVGMVAFYAALAIGPMSLLAPLIALLQTAIPVVVSAASGQELGLTAWIAVGLGLLATTLISVPAGADRAGEASRGEASTELGPTGSSAGNRITPAGGILALVSGITLGLSVVCLDLAPEGSGILPAFLDIAVGLLVLLPLLAVRRMREGDSWLGGETRAPRLPSRPGAGTWAMAAVGGVLLGVGNILLVVALHSGNLAVVAVLIGLYPLATVLLARMLLAERLSTAQLVGVVLAIAAAVLLGLS